MTTVSMNGSHSATKPSETGRRVFTAECAIGAEPRPASLEKAARRKPWMMTPIMPPVTPSGVNAPAKIWPNASGTWPMLMRMTARHEST